MLPGVPGSVYLTWEFAVQLLWNLQLSLKN